MLESYYSLASGVCSTAPAIDDRFLRVATFQSPATRVVFLFILGKSEFCEKYAAFAQGLNHLGIDFVAVEPRGQGGSSRFSHRDRSGHVPNHNVLVNDIRSLLDSGACHRDLSVPIIVGGHSQGAAVLERVLQTASDDHLRAWASGVVFTSPMWSLKSPVASNSAARWWLNIAAPIAPRSKLIFGGRTRRPGSDKFDGNALTADRRRFEQLMALQKMHAEVVTSGTTRGWLKSALKLTGAIARGAGVDGVSTSLPGAQTERRRQLALPGIVFVGENDRLIDLDEVIEIALTRGMAVERIVGRHEPMIGGIALERLVLGRIATFIETRCGIELEPSAMHALDVALVDEFRTRSSQGDRSEIGTDRSRRTKSIGVNNRPDPSIDFGTRA